MFHSPDCGCGGSVRLQVCFGAGALWQGGACCCTSASELSDLFGTGVGAGVGDRTSTSRQSQRESHLRYVMAAGAPHPSVSLFPSPPPSPHPVFLVASLWAVPCHITSALHVSVSYIFPLTLNPPLSAAALFLFVCYFYHYNYCPPSPSG